MFIKAIRANDFASNIRKEKEDISTENGYRVSGIWWYIIWYQDAKNTSHQLFPQGITFLSYFRSKSLKKHIELK